MYKYSLVCFAPSRSGHNFILRNLKRWHLRNLNIIDLEGRFPYEWKQIKIEKEINTNFDKVIKIVVIRDLLNWAASYHNFKIAGIKNNWNEIVKEFFGETNFLGENVVKINYDTFIADNSYRQKIIEKFPKYKQSDMDYVCTQGNGSSFDGMNFQERGRDMDVLNRYKKIKDHPEIMTFLDAKSVELYRKYFEISEEKEEILKLNKK